MIVIKVHRDGAVCARISPLPVLQNNIIIDCFVCDRSAWCLLQGAARPPPSGDVGHCCLQVQVENCGDCWEQFVDPNTQKPRPLNTPPPQRYSHVGCLPVLSDSEFEHWFVLFFPLTGWGF